MAELGEGIMQRSHYAAMRLGAIRGVRAPAFNSAFFKEFVVNFDGTGKTVSQINAALLGMGIFGGKDITQEFPDLGNSALYCVTEVHSKAELDRLVTAVEEAVQ
jgi:glycine dehydrogenase subunit 1